MIKEFQFYHGVVFAVLLHHCKEPFMIEPFPSEDNASYVVNDEVGVYIKYSTKRMSPWHFSFEARHKAEIRKMQTRCARLVIMLVCRDDGVVGLSYEELRSIVEMESTPTEWVSAARRPREKYAIKGSLGKLPLKIGMADCCVKVVG